MRADSLEQALTLAYDARDLRRPLSIGVLGNAAELVPELLGMGAEIDIVTDQTSAHDPLAYLPIGVAFDDWADARRDPGFAQRARESMALHVEGMVGFQRRGAEVFDYGNNLRTEALTAGFADAFAFPGFVPAYIRPLFAEGKGPFRWAALSGEASDIAKTDRAVLELFPENESLVRWIRLAAGARGVPRPARAHLLARLRRARRRRAAVQRHGRVGRARRPDRDRARPPRLRLGGQPVPRDRGDARRLRRDRRLAVAQRAGEHLLGRDLGCMAYRRENRRQRGDGRNLPLMQRFQRLCIPPQIEFAVAVADGFSGHGPIIRR